MVFGKQGALLVDAPQGEGSFAQGQFDEHVEQTHAGWDFEALFGRQPQGCAAPAAFQMNDTAGQIYVLDEQPEKFRI